MKEKFFKHRKWILIGIGLLAVLFTIGIMSNNSIQAKKAKSLETSLSTEEQNNNLTFWGEVTCNEIYDIYIDFPSIVTDIKVKEGDHVSLGQTLVTLDMSEYSATVNKLQQQLTASHAGLQDIIQDTTALEADIAHIQEDIHTKTEESNNATNADLRILQTSLELAKKDVENATRDLEDNRALYETGAVSQHLLDQYTDILSQREKALTDVENNIEKTKKALKSELDQLAIALKSKVAQLDMIRNSNSANTAKQNSSVTISQIDLDMMKTKSMKDYIEADQIISCIQNGIVKNIGVINGTKLGVQNTPTRVLQLIDTDSIVVSAEVDEEFIKSVTLGEKVDVVPVSDSSLSIPGTITQISNTAIEKDGKRIIKIQVKPHDTERKLKPGYTVDVYMPI